MKKIKTLSIIFTLLTIFILTNNVSYAMQAQSTLSNDEVIEKLTENLREKTNSRYREKASTRSILVDKILMTSTSYDSRNNVNINVYNQGETNTCWANASNSTLEIYLEKVNNDSIRLSRRHLVYSVLSPTSGYGKGAWFEDATAVYTSGKGPVLESTMPWQNNENTITDEEQKILNNTSSIRQITGWTKIPPIYKYIENGTVKYTDYDYTSYISSDGNEYQFDGASDKNSIQYLDDSYVKELREYIKNCIMQYGAVFATMDCNYGDKTAKESEELYTSTMAFNRKSNVQSAEGLHAVCIIGWDDNYAVTNFAEEIRPSKPGAYLILNSWGTESHSNGCFWMSYEDIFIEKDLSVFTGVKNVDYSKIYQYDDTGVSSAVYTQDSTSVYGANVFTRENTTEKEKITEIALTNVYDASYEVYINSEDGEISSKKMKKVATVNSGVPGYNTIELETPIELTGEKFAVAVKYIYNSNMGFGLIGIEEPSSYGINT